MHDHKQGAESLVEVTQADREMAAAFFRTDWAREEALQGLRDEDSRVQAFARHRITATSEASLSVERMREALEHIRDDLWQSDARGYDLALAAIDEIRRIRRFARAALNTTAEGGER